jgi:hypothetical protein
MHAAPDWAVLTPDELAMLYNARSSTSDGPEHLSGHKADLFCSCGLQKSFLRARAGCARAEKGLGRLWWLKRGIRSFLQFKLFLSDQLAESGNLHSQGTRQFAFTGQALT